MERLRRRTAIVELESIYQWLLGGVKTSSRRGEDIPNFKGEIEMESKRTAGGILKELLIRV
jgi:hypothetical protein